ncbi:hypothetical protein D3Z48_05235 [Clostridiaceae bacterium]|nr:hypothetical protein [Clostridiaceae bacterium]
MADCQKIMQLCEESIDRTLTPDEQKTLDGHLQSCPRCAAYLADLQFITSALAHVPEPPATLHESIMNSIVTDGQSTVVQPRQPNRRPPVAAMLIAAAACVALVLSGALGNLLNTFDFAMAGGGSNAAGASASDSAAAGGIAPQDAASAEAAPMPAALDGGDAGSAAAENGSAAQPYAEPADAAPQTTTNSAPEEQHAEKAQPRMAQDPSDAGLPAQAKEEEDVVAEHSLDTGDTDGGAGSAAGYALTLESGKSTRSGIIQPQVGAFISNVMGGEVFAACYLVEGGESLPEIGQEQQRDDNFGYYVVENNLAQLETLLDSLEKAGCSVSTYEENGVIFNEGAQQVVFIVRLNG